MRFWAIKYIKPCALLDFTELYFKFVRIVYTSFEYIRAALLQPTEAEQRHSNLAQERDDREHSGHAAHAELVLRDRYQAQVLAQHHRKSSRGPERVTRDLGHAQEVAGARLYVHRLVRVDFEPAEIVGQLHAQRVRHVLHIHERFLHDDCDDMHVACGSRFLHDKFTGDGSMRELSD